MIQDFEKVVDLVQIQVVGTDSLLPFWGQVIGQVACQAARDTRFMA